MLHQTDSSAQPLRNDYLDAHELRDQAAERAMYTYVKICGITNIEDALAAVDAGADFLGLIFYAKSARGIMPSLARQIVAAVRSRPRQPLCVGVFVNEPAESIRAIMAAAKLDLAQLHGDEPAGMMTGLQGAAYKALRPISLESAMADAALFAPLARPAGPRLLLDAYTPTAYGGTGQRGDWRLAAAVARSFPGVMLAGGLNPGNVAEAVQQVLPWGVDVSSGVEAAPGRKDHHAVRQFIANVRSASGA